MNHTIRRGSFLGMLVLIAVNAWGFDGDEHELLSNVAFRAAVRVVPPGNMAAAIAQRKSARTSFGFVTRAVDWFQCPDDFLGQKLDPGESFRSVIDKRRRNYIKRGLASHNNVDHFQDDALDSWRKYHRRAIEHAKDAPGYALLEEAVALHYLQDFFSVGHMVTPRRRMHDAVAGHLHDLYNNAGVKFSIKEPLPHDAINITEDELAKAHWIGAHDIEAFNLAINKSSAFFGDSWLSEPKSAPQRIFIATVSMLSVAQVLSASDGVPRASLDTCFVFRSADPKFDSESKGWVPDYTHIHGPDGGISLGAASFDVAEHTDCNGREWLGRYDALNEPSLTHDSFYSLNGLTLRGEAGVATKTHGVRINTDLLWFILASDPAGRLINSETRKAFDYRDVLGALSMGAIGISRSSGDGYHALGLLYDFYHATGLRGLSWGFRFAPRRYTYNDTHHWKYDYGVKSTVGLDVVSVGLAIERARHFDSLQRFRPTYFVTLGIETSVSPSWVRSHWMHHAKPPHE